MIPGVRLFTNPTLLEARGDWSVSRAEDGTVGITLFLADGAFMHANDPVSLDELSRVAGEAAAHLRAAIAQGGPGELGRTLCEVIGLPGAGNTAIGAAPPLSLVKETP